MKKTLSLLMTCLLCLMMLYGCTNGIADSVGSVDSESVSYTDKDVQLNLAGMSGTVVYSMVYNIMSDPPRYIGQIIRLSGYYSAWQDPNTGMVYHSCVIPDATACCAQGMEFVWSGDHVYPDDYPEFGTEMIVTGRLESYMEGDYMYLHLMDAQVEWKGTDQ